MTQTLVERLRDPVLMQRWWDQYGTEAADEIERLRHLGGLLAMRVMQSELVLDAEEIAARNELTTIWIEDLRKQP